MDVARIVIGVIYGIAITSGIFLTHIVAHWIYETYCAWLWKRRQDRKG